MDSDRTIDNQLMIVMDADIRRTRLMRGVHTRLADELREGPVLRKAFDEWLHQMQRERSNPDRPVQEIVSEECYSRFEDLHVAYIKSEAADARAKYAREVLHQTHEAARIEIELRETVPPDPWDLDVVRIPIRPDEPEQYYGEVLQGALFMASRLENEELGAIAAGDLHPFVRERVGNSANAEFYRDLARLLLADSADIRTFIGRLCTEREFVSEAMPVYHLVQLMLKASKPC